MRKVNMLDALLPRTRQNILAILLLSPERRWYLSDLAQHLGVPPSSLQRELVSLTEAGVLCRETDGNRVYFQASSSYPLLPELQGIFAKTVGLADQVRTLLEPFWDQIELAYIFGSMARGERTAGSDLDVIIVGKVAMADLALPLRELERTLHIPVNVIHFTGEEFQNKLRQKNHFLMTTVQNKKIFLKGSEDELANIADKSTDQSTHDEQAGIG